MHSPHNLYINLHVDGRMNFYRRPSAADAVQLQFVLP